MKISIVGVGNVGGTLAFLIASNNIADEISLIDINENIAKAKEVDIRHSLSIFGSNTKINSGNNFSISKSSDIIVITSGVARKPGMTREELVNVNGKIIEDVTEKIMKYNENPIIIVVSNPLDIMTFIALKKSKLNKNKVFGMAGGLDISRYKSFIKEKLDISSGEIKAIILGGHGDDMLPLIRYTSVSGINIKDFLKDKEIDEIVKKTQHAGAEIVSLLGTSAYYAPASGILEIINAIKYDKKSIISVSYYLEGEYKLNNICIGVPCIIGKNGVEKIIELDLTDNEFKKFKKSYNKIKETLNIFYKNAGQK